MNRRAKVESGRRRKLAQLAPYDVVAFVASAGGHAAIESILRALPADFSVPMVVIQHLAPGVELPFRSTRRPLPFTVRWAQGGEVIAPRCVLVAPPRTFFELLPDGTCAVSPCARGALDKPIDRLLQSLAESFAHRAIGVVLSGMLDDGADGAFELRSVGGAVIVQSGAEYGSMPQAAIGRGGADVALPVEEIAGLLVELAAGGDLPRPPSELRSRAGVVCRRRAGASGDAVGRLERNTAGSSGRMAAGAVDRGA